MPDNVFEQAAFEQVVDAARSLGVTEIEAIITTETQALTRFANNTIHQNVAERETQLSVRPVIEGRTARGLDILLERTQPAGIERQIPCRLIEVSGEDRGRRQAGAAGNLSGAARQIHGRIVETADDLLCDQRLQCSRPAIPTHAFQNSVEMPL